MEENWCLVVEKVPYPSGSRIMLEKGNGYWDAAARERQGCILPALSSRGVIVWFVAMKRV